MSKPEGRGGAWTEERGTSDEGRRDLKSAPEASQRHSEPEAQRAGDTVSRLLRTMTLADIDAVLGLEQELFGEEAWSQQMLEGELAEQPRSRYYLVAAVDGLI
ncbi:MAG TPA: hypothetical protein VH307_23255, partial [Streptosporangiaceae bacterium]|nr:hypothetical protein [Streptosporangiaceae bacterium]